MSERGRHMTSASGMSHGVPGHPLLCSPYSGSKIDISGIPPTHPPENQGTRKSVPQTPVLHITPPIFQSTPPHPFFNSPYQGGDLDITGGAIPSWPEPQPVTSSAVLTAVLHIAPPIQHIGAHHRQQPAFRVSDRSGTLQAAFNSLEFEGIEGSRGVQRRARPRGFARGHAQHFDKLSVTTTN